MTLTIEKGSGNVFADMGMKNPDAQMLRSELCFELFKIMNDIKITQSQASDLFGVKQPHISRLKRGDLSHYSLESIIGFLNKLNKKVVVNVSSRRKNEPLQKLIVKK